MSRRSSHLSHVVCLALVPAGVVLSGCGGSSAGDVSAAVKAMQSRPFVPQATAAAAEPQRPSWRYEVAWLTRSTRLRAAPGGRVIKRLRTTTEFGSPSALAIVGRRRGWLRVASAVLPNGRRGWIRAADATVRGTNYDIQVDRSARRATFRQNGRVLMRFRVAVGRPGNETPLGRFAITDKLRTTKPGSPYGCCAVALTGHQTKLDPGWPGGDRLAIHGTPVPASIGQAASLGCMRAHAAPLRKLMRRVPLGAPVFIRA